MWRECDVWWELLKEQAQFAYYYDYSKPAANVVEQKHANSSWKQICHYTNVFKT